MRESIADDEFPEYHRVLLRVIDRQPKVFQKWSEIRDRFEHRGWADEASDPPYYIEDALLMINEAMHD